MKTTIFGTVPSMCLLAGLLGGYGLEQNVLAGEALEGHTGSSTSTVYRSPYSLATSPDGTTVYVSDPTSGSVSVLDVARGIKRDEIAVHANPRGLCLSADGGVLYVAEHGAGTVAIIDTSSGQITGRVHVGRWPTAIALAPQSNRLFVCNQDDHTVSMIDLSQVSRMPVTQIAVVREPSCVAVTADERFVVVTNQLPAGAGTDPSLAAVVSLIDTSQLKQIATVELPPGSTLVNGVCTSPDGKWAYVVHGLGRFNLPITQLERGWVNTYALSIIDITTRSRVATILLDDLTQGAADPHSVVCSQDGATLWISHAGVHEVSIIDIRLIHELLVGKVPAKLEALRDGTQSNIWVRIRNNRQIIADLENDLTALYIAGAIRRVSSVGNSPRGLAISPDGVSLYVANYYSGTVAVLDAITGKLVRNISLGPQPDPRAARRGEIIFHDATKAFQRWHSCATCHPNQGRVDGLRWDFLRDGIGNGKDTLSLVFFHKTAPLNRRATRKTAEECALTSVIGSHMIVPSEREVQDLHAYLVSLRPDPNPYLNSEGSISDAARRGRKIFDGEADCKRCHPAPYFTDKKMHNVGVLSHNEPDGRYDTPALLEAHRTGPYLHDGRAKTIRDVLTIHNSKGRHGKTAGLSVQEVDCLVAYLMTL